MFVYFWIPNTLFQALHVFNWMTWISPQNSTLAMITGGYGGMGFNPLGTFDWSLSGTNSLVTPFFSAVQQYIATVVSGLIIIGMYWGNMYWGSYMPINSNDAFTDTAEVYNVSVVLSNNLLNATKYANYSFPYFSAANLYGSAWFAWYPMALFYVIITQWPTIQHAGISMYRSLREKKSLLEENKDSHSIMMSRYKEVPDWWYFLILLIALVFGIIALVVYPLEVPVWVLFVILIISLIFLIPMVIMISSANVLLTMGVLFQVLPSWWFPGNPIALLVVGVFAYNLDAQAEAYMSNQKMAHYAKIPPRAIFRGQTIAVLINAFGFVGIADWMINNFKGLCEWDQPQHFVCEPSHGGYSGAAVWGVAGAKRVFEQYPIIPYCFLIGALVGIIFGLGQVYGTTLRERIQKGTSEITYEFLDKHIFRIMRWLKNLNPPVVLSGSLKWTGGSNLSWYTNALYLSAIFMYYIKRRYTLWWQKYNYLLEAGFDSGVALSALVQVFALGWNNIAISWWGNNISKAGIDWQSYNQNGTLYALPASGHFGS